jgi:predicted transcriptional regulator
LHVLWRDGPSTIRHLTEALYAGDVETQYSTVKQLLARLETKGYVGRDSREFAHVFAATLDRDELVGRRLQRLTESLCDGTILPLLPHLVSSQNLTDKQRQKLVSLIEELKGRSKAHDGRKKRKSEECGP